MSREFGGEGGGHRPRFKPLLSVTRGGVVSAPSTSSATTSRHPNTTSFHQFNIPSLSKPKPPLLPAMVLADDRSEHDNHIAYRILWRKSSSKMHKVWSNDGVLLWTPQSSTIHIWWSSDGGASEYKTSLARLLGLARASTSDLERLQVDGKSLLLCGRELCVDEQMSTLDMEAFLDKRSEHGSLVNQRKRATKENIKPSQEDQKSVLTLNASASCVAKPFKSLRASSGHKKSRVSLFDPNAEGAIALPRLPEQSLDFQVVIDPWIAKNLRPHQIEGVTFLYSCIHGLTKSGGQGAILADGMGLGKTLTAIALIWTCLKQNSFKKILVVCTTSLLGNWKREFDKWLGSLRISVLVIQSTSNATLSEFDISRKHDVLLIGYEKLRASDHSLQVDLVICDEGHRLKNESSQVFKALDSLATRRRIILSGTPIQNDLEEFYAMSSFVNPGFMDRRRFMSEFVTPILSARDADASEDEMKAGKEKLDNLTALTSSFMLRRSSESILSKVLPPKTEIILFVQMTNSQMSQYERLLAQFDIGLDHNSVLPLITKLRKCCTSFVMQEAGRDQPPLDDMSEDDLFQSSGKIQILFRILRDSVSMGSKVVVVVHQTSFLPILSRLCASRGYKWVQLDGSMPSAHRQTALDTFYKGRADIFLLSAKAGGVGLNLVQADRLVLLDIDWNPAICQQAMARVWRDGQLKPVYIYRLLSTGTIEEKILQRQLTKSGLAYSLLSGPSTEATSRSDESFEGDRCDSFRSFTAAQLRNLLSFDRQAACTVHQEMECTCSCDGRPSVCTESHAEYMHLNPAVMLQSNSQALDDNALVEDPVLKRMISNEGISFVFLKRSGT